MYAFRCTLTRRRSTWPLIVRGSGTGAARALTVGAAPDRNLAMHDITGTVRPEPVGASTDEPAGLALPTPTLPDTMKPLVGAATVPA